jgi:hypothetical protein
MKTRPLVRKCQNFGLERVWKKAYKPASRHELFQESEQAMAPPDRWHTAINTMRSRGYKTMRRYLLGLFWLSSVLSGKSHRVTA